MYISFFFFHSLAPSHHYLPHVHRCLQGVIDDIPVIDTLQNLSSCLPVARNRIDQFTLRHLRQQALYVWAQWQRVHPPLRSFVYDLHATPQARIAEPDENLVKVHPLPIGLSPNILLDVDRLFGGEQNAD